MLRWTLLATLCSSVLQVSIANAPLSGGDDKDELRSDRISNALDAAVESRNHVTAATALATPVTSDGCDYSKSVTWELWKPLRCASCKSNVTFPVAFTNRQYWTRSTWAYCTHQAITFTKVDDSLPSDEFRAFCPANVSNAYLRGMFIYVKSPIDGGRERWLPAEFLIPCDYDVKGGIKTEWAPKNRSASLVHVIQRFQANLVEGSHAPCTDQFGNAHVTPQDAFPACQYGTHVAAVGLSYAIHFMWTNNNYADLMEMFSPPLNASVPVGLTKGTAAVWRPIVDITGPKNQCTLKYGYDLEPRFEDGKDHIQIYYGAECACSANLEKCNPMQIHPYEGICPRSATIYIHWNELGLDVESLRDAKAFTNNPFEDYCTAYILFRTHADDRFEMQIELGERCPTSGLDTAEHGCHQFVRDCYGIQPRHVAIACCNATFCDPAYDSSCIDKPEAERFASGELMKQINVYLWNREDPQQLSTKVINQIDYCAYHSNVWSEGYSEERPEYCYVFVDHKWREFVNISSGWNFDFSPGERLHFPKGRVVFAQNAVLIHRTLDKNCTIVHGTARDYCPSILDCTEEIPALRRNVCPRVDENDKQHTVVACRCSAHENRTYYCDENITATDVLNWVEKPQCFTGTVPYRVRGRYDSSELTLVQSEDLNVLCYWYDYQDDDGKRWREYGFYNPEDVRFAGYRSLNCFPADCTPKRTLPHFCCCRTAENGAESVCNYPGSPLEEEVHVRHDRRDPGGMSTNVVERNLCEARQPDHHVNVTDPQELVVGLPARAMCYYKLELRHRKGSGGHNETSADEVMRRFYDASLQKQFPLSVLLCDRKRWTVSDWLDGCACLAARNGAQWEQNCCCISSTNPSSMEKAVKSEHEHRLRTFRDFL